MGRVSDKSSYKNIKNAVKSSQFFATKQAARKQRQSKNK
jgi:hypothetical protein